MACCGCGSGVDDYGDDEDNVGDDDGDCHLLLLGGRLVVVVVDGGVGRAQAIFQLVVSFFKWVAFVIFNLFFFVWLFWEKSFPFWTFEDILH